MSDTTPPELLASLRRLARKLEEAARIVDEVTSFLHPQGRDPLAEVEILYQDEHLVAVSKPSGVFVHRTDLAPDREVLLQHVRDKVGAYLFPVHRLDRATSGIVIFALSREAARGAQAALAAGEKVYLALARGVTPLQGVLDGPLTRKRDKVKQAAITEYERLGVVAERHSLLKVVPRTGRRHQIRRHLAREKHQLIGDTSYGKSKINRYFQVTYGLPRLVLHACQLRLRHPQTGEELTIRAPLPEDLAGFLARLPGFSHQLLTPLWSGGS